MQEFLNRIELKGVVGAVSATSFSVMTETLHGECVEVSWFSCVSMDKPDIKKGDFVHLVGRLRTKTYTGLNGEPRAAYEIIVKSVEKCG